MHLPQKATVATLLDEYAARGVFRVAQQPGQLGLGSEFFELVWFRNQTMTLELTAKPPRVRLVNVLPAITPRSRLDRQLRVWLTQRQADALPAHRRIDPANFALRLSRRDGKMTLELRSASADLVVATEKLVRLVNELYLDFLAAPERFDWVQDVFDLDPDNPRWP
jgi:hypothetical protein